MEGLRSVVSEDRLQNRSQEMMNLIGDLETFNCSRVASNVSLAAEYEVSSLLLLVLFVLSIVLAVSFVLSFCYFSKGLSFRSIDDEMETRAERIVAQCQANSAI